MKSVKVLVIIIVKYYIESLIFDEMAMHQEMLW
jgi:hypothetical protein